MQSTLKARARSSRQRGLPPASMADSSLEAQASSPPFIQHWVWRLGQNCISECKARNAGHHPTCKKGEIHCFFLGIIWIFNFFFFFRNIVSTLLSNKGLKGLIDCCTLLCGQHGPGQYQQSAMATGREWSATLKHSELQWAEWGSQSQENFSGKVSISFLCPSLSPPFSKKKRNCLFLH